MGQNAKNVKIRIFCAAAMRKFSIFQFFEENNGWQLFYFDPDILIYIQENGFLANILFQSHFANNAALQNSTWLVKILSDEPKI